MSAMFEIDESSLPFVRTRHALLALDLQSDFISPDATIPVTNPPNFVDNIVNLASKFRSFGSVIWIRTVFEASRPVNVDGNSESVITNAELPTRGGGEERPEVRQRPSQKLIERYSKLVETEAGSSEEAAAALQNDEEDDISETFLTLEPGRSLRAVSPASPGTNLSKSVVGALDATKDLIFQKTYYSAFKDGQLVQTLRAKFVTEIYICGTLTNISVFATAMDAARHGYGITIVDDCLGYRSKARHDEALRKLVEFTGCDMKSSADLIEDINEIERAAQRVRQPTPRRKPRPQECSNRKDADLDNQMTSLNLGSDSSTAPRINAAPTGQAKAVAAAETRGSPESPTSREQAQELKLPTRTPSNEVKRERVKSKIKARRRPSKSGAKDTGVAGEPSGSSSVEKSSSAATSGTSIAISQSSAKTSVLDKGDAKISRLSLESTTSLGVENAPTNPGKGKDREEQGRSLGLNLDDEVEKMAKLSVKEDSSGLCEGDTTIIHDLLDAEVAKGIFESVRDEVRWQKMSHQGGDVPRLVSVQGEMGEDGSIPIYRHPADESPPLLQFSPNVSQIRKRVEEKLGHPVNHVLIQVRIFSAVSSYFKLPQLFER
jgi:nicotinamidase-related amidase